MLLIANGALIITAFALLLGSLSFWFVKTEMFGEHMLNATINFGLYPDGIFKGAVKFLLCYVIPTGMMIYKPVRIMTEPDLGGLAVVAGYAFLLLAAAVTVFYRGLKKYSSGNLMSARV